jgi:hypothetical protein
VPGDVAAVCRQPYKARKTPRRCALVAQRESRGGTSQDQLLGLSSRARNSRCHGFCKTLCETGSTGI